MNLNHPSVVELLENNYKQLNRVYRLGGFEDMVPYVDRKLPDSNESFYELARKESGIRTEVTFEKAIENFHDLITYLEVNDQTFGGSHAILLLRCKNLIYEAYDYALKMRNGIEEYFLAKAQKFIEHPTAKYMERWAEELNGSHPFTRTSKLTAKEQRTRVIKDLLMAVLCAANFYLRQHDKNMYEKALNLLGKVEDYVIQDLPAQHEIPRSSYGLLGLTLYLKGRVLMAHGSYDKSRTAFRKSAEAYVDRLRQKEANPVNADDPEGKEILKEKISVTVRRVAMVTAFGDGYLSYLTGQIDRALEALTLARATLTQNCGSTYLSYCELWFWACQRAKNSSDKAAIDKVIAGLNGCLEQLPKSTSYTHWAEVELALAWYYKGKLSPKDFHEAFEKAKGLLESAIKYAQGSQPKKYKNPHLLGDALIFKSYLLRAHFRSKGRTARRSDVDQDLRRALEAAKTASAVADSRGTAPLRAEAYAALGAVYTDLVEFRLGENFYDDFDRAHSALQQSLKENVGRNIRLDAAAHLRLAKLYLQNSNTKILAYEQFEKFKQLESKVDHAYLKQMARDLETKMKLKGPFLLIKADTLDRTLWEEELFQKLFEVGVQQFIAKEKVEGNDAAFWDKRVTKYLIEKLNYNPKKIKVEVETRKLGETLLRLRELPSPTTSSRRQKRTSVVKKKSSHPSDSENLNKESEV